MKVLAIDSASSILSVAVSHGDEIFYTETEAGMKHSELVMDCIANQMKKARLETKDLEGVLCLSGPGSFTGLRIGYSTAKGLALSLSIPFAAVPALDCIAFQKTDGIVLAMIKASKNACFYAFFQNGKRITDDKDGDFAQIAEEISLYREKITLTGPGAVMFYDSLPQEQKNGLFINSGEKGCAKEIIAVAQIRKILDNDNSEFLHSGPDYIRLPDAQGN
jgi:tRNA threonylcarbamoyladenosine biosynthesis protein TsaB